jgi:hypothetical protein
MRPLELVFVQILGKNGGVVWLIGQD